MTSLYIKSPSTFKTEHFIGGKFVSSTSSKDAIKVMNPSTKEEMVTVNAGGADDVEKAVKAAKIAYEKGLDGHKAWKETEGAERNNYLIKLSNLVERDLDELTYLDNICMGGPAIFSQTAAPLLRYAGGWAQRITGQTSELQTTHDGNTVFNYTLKQPFGVVAAIIPWNIPTLAFVMKVSFALSTGNTLVIKPSEKSPLSAGKLCALIKEAGIPPGVVNMVQGYGKPVGEALALHMDVRKISFTGSGLTGRSIAINAAKSNLKNVSLELGGKSAAIIFDDADIPQAVAANVQAIFLNNGQICVAHSRVFVHESISQQYTSALEKSIKEWKVGDFLSETYAGPLADEVQFNKVLSYLEKGKQEGKLVTGGLSANSEGFFVEPTLFTQVSDDAIINKEEIFGPVLIVHTFKTEEEVIKRANDSEYGLSGAVFTKDLSRGLRVARALETGTLSINGGINLALTAPFGGYKQSGMGREMGGAFLESYLETKNVSVFL